MAKGYQLQNDSGKTPLTDLAALTASRAVVSDGSGNMSAATTTAAEIGYVNGVTSAIQTQLNSKSAFSALHGWMCTVGVPNSGGDISSIVTWATGNDSSIFLNDNVATNAIRMYRFDIGTGGGLSVNNDGTNAYWFNNTSYQNALTIAMAQGATDYIYMWAQKVADTNWYLLRITISDGTVTEMTFSGTAPDNDANNRIAFNSSGQIAILDLASTTCRVYTISGTTATLSTTVTLSATQANAGELFTIDNSDNFIYASAQTIFKVDNSSGANVKTRVSPATAPTVSVRYGVPRCLFKSNSQWYGFTVINTDATAGTGIGQLQFFSGY